MSHSFSIFGIHPSQLNYEFTLQILERDLGSKKERQTHVIFKTPLAKTTLHVPFLMKRCTSYIPQTNQVDIRTSKGKCFYNKIPYPTTKATKTFRKHKWIPARNTLYSRCFNSIHTNDMKMHIAAGSIYVVSRNG
jgi:hypothetical protein